MKTLHLLRHAKSDWSDETLDDHDRPLKKRGRRARLLVARYVEGWTVDLVVCSTATRARQTAEPVAEVLGCPVRYEPAVYAADTAGLLELVRELPDETAAVLVVGHNPGMEDLTELLCGESPHYPTAALGTITLDVEHWSGAGPGVGALVAHVVPADLE